MLDWSIKKTDMISHPCHYLSVTQIKIKFALSPGPEEVGSTLLDEHFFFHRHHLLLSQKYKI